MKKLLIDRNRTVSLDVDAQNGFTFNCPDELPVCNEHDIDDECNKSATKAKYRYASKDAHPENAEWNASDEKPQLSVVGLENVDIRWNKHCVVDTFGFELISKLPKMSEYDFFIYKGVEKDMHPYSPCYHDLAKKISTGIIEKAKCDNIKTFILNGLALTHCLGEGAIDLFNAKFEVIINLGATRGIGTPEEINIYIEKLKDIGIKFVNSADDIMDY